MELNEFHIKLIKQYCFDHKVKQNNIDPKLFNLWMIKRSFQNEIESVYNLNEDEIFSLIEKIVIWYYRVGSNANPDELLDKKDKLVTFIYWINERLGRTEKKYEQKQQHNKIEIDRFISQSSKDIGVHTARANAKSNKSNELLQEAAYKGEIKEMERVLNSLDKIVAAMQQRIAWLRQEAAKTTTF